MNAVHTVKSPAVLSLYTHTAPCSPAQPAYHTGLDTNGAHTELPTRTQRLPPPLCGLRYRPPRTKPSSTSDFPAPCFLLQFLFPNNPTPGLRETFLQVPKRGNLEFLRSHPVPGHAQAALYFPARLPPDPAGKGHRRQPPACALGVVIITAVTGGWAGGREGCRPRAEPGAQGGRGDAPGKRREAAAAAAAPSEPGAAAEARGAVRSAPPRRAQRRARAGSHPLCSRPGSRGACGAGSCFSRWVTGARIRRRGSASGGTTQPPVSLPQLPAAAACPARDGRRSSAAPARRPAGRTLGRTHSHPRTHRQQAAATAAMLARGSGKFPAGLGRGRPCSQVSASRTRRASPGSPAG